MCRSRSRSALQYIPVKIYCTQGLQGRFSSAAAHDIERDHQDGCEMVRYAGDTAIDISSQWLLAWKSAPIITSHHPVDDPTIRQARFDLTRGQCSLINLLNSSRTLCCLPGSMESTAGCAAAV